MLVYQRVLHQHIHMHGPPSSFRGWLSLSIRDSNKSWQCYDSCDPHGETGVHVFFLNFEVYVVRICKIFYANSYVVVGSLLFSCFANSFRMFHAWLVAFWGLQVLILVLCHHYWGPAPTPSASVWVGG